MPTSAGPRALFCVESDQVWFESTLQIECDPFETMQVQVSPLFLETIEPETLLVRALVPDAFCEMMASIQLMPGVAYLQVAQRSENVVRFTVTLAGIRAGCAGYERLPSRTEREMNINNENWRRLSGAGLLAER